MENNTNDNNSGVFDKNLSADNIGREEISDVGNNKDSALGAQNVEKESFSEGTPIEEQEKGTSEQAEDIAEKAEDGGEAPQSDDMKRDSVEYVWNSGEHSSWGDPSSTYHFKPENMREYVGKGTEYYSSANNVYTQDDKDKEPGKSTRNRRARGVIVALVAALIVVSLVAGCALGYIVARGPVGPVGNDDQTNADGVGDETIEMTKNDKPINVTITPGGTDYEGLTKSEVVSLVSDAVVEVTTSIVQTNSFYGGSYVTSGAGSGVVIAQSEEYAYIVTNYHVIDGATSVSVTLTDKTVVDAEYLDGDVNYDIAMMRIKTDKEFPKLVCGSSASLKVGDDVLAIGNPLGQLGGTVTEGIVSALNREVTIENIKMTLLQTSAAVNPGNSGGGLFNMAGELIGIVNAKQSAEGIEGLAFAIPIDIVYDKLVEIIENGYIHGRASLGIETEYVSDIWEARSKYSLNATGVFVTSSSIDTIKAKDLIYSINGQRVSDGSTYAAIISSLKIGDKVTVVLYRAGKSTTVEVTVVEYVPTGIFG